MSTFKKVAVGSLAAVLVAAVALPVAADRWGPGEGRGWHKSGWHEGGWHKGGRHGRGQMAMRFMERFDTDGDGKLTQAEIDAVTAGMFGAADADASGGVTLPEFKTAFAREFADRKVRAFQRMDRDGDDALTRAEYDRMTARMESRMDDDDDDRRGWRKRWSGKRGGMMTHYDTDGDGTVTPQEIAAARAALFGDADQNADGALSLDEFESVWVAMADGRMVRMFQRLDRDGDLTITEAEATRPTANLVARMDRNGDGVLSIEDRSRRGWKDRDGKGRDGMRGNRDD
ncbi:hypothetical protein [Stappia sp.]|uniref:EF-hand domain-containing protein n=1 Tax=Stappia sp. TaxID=1870903 RepID=UPI0032D8D356